MRRRGPRTTPVVAALLGVLSGDGAMAQVAASASLTSNLLYRGFSLSDGAPALALSLAYDAPAGLYAGGSAIGDDARHRGARFLGHVEYAGYAVRTPRGPTLDAGVTHANYARASDSSYHIDATEFYAGVASSAASAYLFYSPNYFSPGFRTLYADFNVTAHPARRWRLLAHLGVLTPTAGGADRRERYDARVGVAVPFRGGEVQLTWSDSRPGLDYLNGYATGRGVVAFSVTRAF